MTRLATAIAVLGCLWATSASAATLQPIGRFEGPVFVTSDPGNPERLFVVERPGRIAEVNEGTTRTFADLTSQITTGEEGGLLSIALAPDFDSSGRLFVDYTGNETPWPAIHVAEMRASGNSAPLSTLRNLLTIEHPEDTDHYAGQLQFGPEGMLFVSTGDGGISNDEFHNAQNLEKPLGKLLRIDPNPSGSSPYTIPAGNPFASIPADFAPIWSYGLRNPFRFSFDRLTHAIYIADVGQDREEEVDSAPAPGLGIGANYGWNCREGTIEGPATDEGCAGSEASDFVEPIFTYAHQIPTSPCAIIGGYVSRDAGLASLYGRYVYGDHCTGEIRSFDPANPRGTDRFEGLQVEELDSFGEDSCGRLYAVSGKGVVSRVEGPTPTDCSTPTTARAASFVGIRAHGRRIRRHHRALLTAWVSPCNGRKGEPVKLFEGRRHVATRYLDRACTVRFRPRIRHRTTFRAYVGEDESYVAAISRKLKIKIDHRRKARRPGRAG
ncbi:MAG TPA: PQQ-dependent sugar dehydrogenase [Solirubrobacterales bacterium]